MIQKDFKLVSNYKPAGDQPQAIEKLINGLNSKKHQVLLGATGTGKTFTIANIIEEYNRQTLVLAHNKTLALQLYYELKGFFPENRVEYFVSNFDFFQPEAYLPNRDMYIDKTAKQNLELDMMRLSSLNALMTRKDTIVVSSVAAIYSQQNPNEYADSFFELSIGQKISKKNLLGFLIKTGYIRNDLDNAPGTFSAKGDVIKIIPGWNADLMFRISMFDDEIEAIDILSALNNIVKNKTRMLTIFPAQAYVTNQEKLDVACLNIEKEMQQRVQELIDNGLLLEAQRLESRTKYDLESLKEFGSCAGIENYSAQLDFRKPGEKPFSLLDYFEKDFLTIVDESHIMLPQIRGMYSTDRSRKTTLVEYGFRLPSAIDNRPLNFDEFNNSLNKVIYISATPGDYELELVKNDVVQQIIRPTGLLDPIIEIRDTTNQIEDIIIEIKKRKKQNERVFITTTTIRMSEDLTSYLQQRNIKVAYVHSELKTLERSEILNDLRKGIYDVIVGVNLLREGIDAPEVSLVCVLDANKNGFLRNTRSLIQISGRAARNANGKVIFYADSISSSMQETIDETNRRRKIQIQYNLEHHIVPKTILKHVQESILNEGTRKEIDRALKFKTKTNKKQEIQKIIDELRVKMLSAAKELDFETAATIRDAIIELENKKNMQV